jgi:hypothetical protein
MSAWYESLVHSQFLKIYIIINLIFVFCIAICVITEKKRINGGSYRDIQKIRSVRRAKWAWVGIFVGFFGITTVEAAQYFMRHETVTMAMEIGVLGLGFIGALAGALWGSIKGRRMQSTDGFGSADAMLYNGGSQPLTNKPLISMTKISSASTQFYKKLFPLFWFGFLTFFIIGMIKDRVYEKAPEALLIPWIALVVGVIVMKKLVWDLADEVYDCGDFLFIKKSSIEERVKLSDIMNVSASTNTNPQRITLRLVHPVQLGSEISFSPVVPFVSLNPFAKNKIAEDLIIRVDQARAQRQLDPIKINPEGDFPHHRPAQMTKLRLITFAFWLIVNGIAIPFLWHQEQEYRTKEYVIKGRGSHAKVIKKSDDPDYYDSRMSYFWVGYIAVPLLGGLVLYQGVRKIENGKA